MTHHFGKLVFPEPNGNTVIVDGGPNGQFKEYTGGLGKSIITVVEPNGLAIEKLALEKYVDRNKSVETRPPAINIKVVMPVGPWISIVNKKGLVRLDGLFGRCFIDCKEGNVIVTGANQSGRINAENGYISLLHNGATDTPQEFSVEAGGGHDIFLTEVRMVKASTDGTIYADHCSRSILNGGRCGTVELRDSVQTRVYTGDGDIFCEDSDSVTLIAHGEGSIDLMSGVKNGMFKGKLSRRYRVQSNNGDITPSDSRQVYLLTTGDGEVRISNVDVGACDTNEGSIYASDSKILALKAGGHGEIYLERGVEDVNANTRQGHIHVSTASIPNLDPTEITPGGHGKHIFHKDDMQ